MVQLKPRDGEAKRIWQRFGATFGSDNNAETTFTGTTYKLDLPSATENGLDESMKILAGMVEKPNITTAALNAERPAVLAERRVVAMWQPLDERVRVCLHRRRDDRLARQRPAALGDGLGHAASERRHLARHQADLRAQRVERELADIAPVDHDLPDVRVVQTRQQLHDRAFRRVLVANQG